MTLYTVVLFYRPYKKSCESFNNASIRKEIIQSNGHPKSMPSLLTADIIN